jgi:hypothetical protein
VNTKFIKLIFQKNYENTNLKKVCKNAPIGQCYKTFFICKKVVRVFVLGMPFCISLRFVSEARAYLSEVSSRLGSCLYPQIID